MRTWTSAAAVALAAIAAAAGPPDDPKPPAPGTRGNPDNVPYIGKTDPKGNPVRLARATGHVSNYSEEKVRPYTLPDPLLAADGRRVTTTAAATPRSRPTGRRSSTSPTGTSGRSESSPAVVPRPA